MQIVVICKCACRGLLHGSCWLTAAAATAIAAAVAWLLYYSWFVRGAVADASSVHAADYPVAAAFTTPWRMAYDAERYGLQGMIIIFMAYTLSPKFLKLAPDSVHGEPLMQGVCITMANSGIVLHCL
jgi:hypothetical protein